MTMRIYPPAELDAESGALAALGQGLTGIAIQAYGDRIHAVWLHSSGGDALSIGVSQRDLEFKFEVFPLSVLSLAGLRDRVAAWPGAPLPDDVPEPFRTLLSTPPAAPEAPAQFDPWPFDDWEVEVLRGTDYIVDIGPGGDATFGDSPNLQTTARPGHVPPEATAACEVAEGLLFTGKTGECLLIAADVMPFDLLVTQDPGVIDTRILHCERVALADYLTRLAAT